MSGIRKNVLLSIAAAFLLCGVLKSVLYYNNFTFGFSQLFTGSFVLIWGNTIQKRVTDRRLRRLLLAIAGLLLFQLLLQLIRYDLFVGVYPFRRWLWYIYYVPMTAVPVLCLAALLT